LRKEAAVEGMESPAERRPPHHAAAAAATLQRARVRAADEEGARLQQRVLV
jgi:hypothetical protein